MFRPLHGSVFKHVLRRLSTHTHTYAQTTPSRNRLHLLAVCSASAVIGTSYVAWRVGLDGQTVNLDSHASSTYEFRSSRLSLHQTPAELYPEEQLIPSSSISTDATEPASLLPPTHAEASDIRETVEQKSEEEAEAGAETEAEAEAEDSGGEGGAFNPVTGEINWDCPCLGGMAHGICGAQFREAFSCFVYSEDEPKGINCVEKFKAMQDCFREHPDVYGEGAFTRFPLHDIS